ncbi:MAG: cell division protein ZapA [Myxococcota bacterium]|jgi:cell division protein ZapA
MSDAHDITLMGREFRIRSDDAPEHVEAVAEYVNGKLHTLMENHRGAAPQHIVLMVAMGLADELFKVRAEHEALANKIRSTSRKLLERMTPEPPALH